MSPIATVAWLAAGGVLGSLFLAYAARRGGGSEDRTLAVGLLIAALLYVVFAVPSGDLSRVALEAAGVGGFALPVWAGLRRPRTWWGSGVLAAGWLAHVLWDGVLHLGGPVAGLEWYATLCLSFDVLVAGRILVRVTRGRRDEMGLQRVVVTHE